MNIKTKVFLDTTVISFLFNTQRPEWEKETWAFWERMISGKYDVYLSNVVLEEIFACGKPKLQKMKDMLTKIDFTEIVVNDEIIRIANEIIRLEILSEKNRVDCLHIGAAMFSYCDFLLSWNITNLAKRKTNFGVRYVAELFEYPGIEIIEPKDLF